MQKIVGGLLLLSLVTCQSALSLEKPPLIDEQMVKCAKNAWEKQAGKVERRWLSQVTPTLPNEWPPKKGLLLVAYGYLYRFPDQGADFVLNAGPYCKVVFDPAKPDSPPNQRHFLRYKTIRRSGLSSYRDGRGHL